MADPVDISVGDLAVAIRVATDASAVPAPIAMVLGYHLPAASELIELYAPLAPLAVKNAAAIRLVGWLYDSDPAGGTAGRALELSGAGQLLQRWRVHRAGAIGDAAPTGGGTVPTGAGLPPLPGSGSFILTVNNGELAWVEFPLP